MIFLNIVDRMYCKVTKGIKVTVIPIFQQELSSYEESTFVWAYNIYLENDNKEPVQLLNRYWHIVDANGFVQEVRGPGVIGQQPTLRYREAFEYTSQVHLRTISGIMVGRYEMINHVTHEIFDVSIPPFSLDIPHVMPQLH